MSKNRVKLKAICPLCHLETDNYNQAKSGGWYCIHCGHVFMTTSDDNGKAADGDKATDDAVDDNDETRGSGSLWSFSKR